MSTIEEIRLKNYIKECVSNSIVCCTADKRDWYKTCTYDDYKDSLISDLYDENGNLLGQGINYISNVIIVNDDNIDNIKNIFEDACSEAYNDFVEEN